MMSRVVRRWVALSCVLVSSAAPAPFVPHDLSIDATAPKPNILVFLVDDMGYSDLAAFGSPNHTTPHIDALASSGMKFTQWISGASICTPSRAALQTGRYPIRTGCMGNIEAARVIPTPSNPGGLDPAAHMSIATALKQVGYATGMSGKWHLGDNGNAWLHAQDHRFAPPAHSYDSYLGSPYTNAPMCEMDGDGISALYPSSPSFCFLTANNTVVQQPLRLENFTRTITKHALDFLARQSSATPWFFFMSYFHVHTPLFTNRTNRGRSRGGTFGDNVEEMDDSVGEIMTALRMHGFDNNTLIFLTSDNGPYQEEGWERTGRTAVYDDDKKFVGRLTGGKGQLYEGGVRMPGIAVWPGVVKPGSVSDTMVSTMDIFPTAVAVAGVRLGESYTVDGKDMQPVLRGAAESQHDVFLHYCGFNIVAARVSGRYKVFWATNRWYTNDAANYSVCTQCCNGVNPKSRLTGAIATELCDCNKDLTWHTDPIVYDMLVDRFELAPLSKGNWPAGSTTNYTAVVAAANVTRTQMIAQVHPKPGVMGGGTCTEGIPATYRQPCCPGCHASGFPFPLCKRGMKFIPFESNCTCDMADSAQDAASTFV